MAWTKKNPEARKVIVRRYKDKNYVARKIRLYEKYGVNFLRLFAHEQGKCAICGKPAKRLFELVLDHDHKTGQGRGLLCQKHNVALGLFGDSPALLSQAIAYLSRDLPAEVFDTTDAPDPAPRLTDTEMWPDDVGAR
jgi:hypothetical protein